LLFLLLIPINQIFAKSDRFPLPIKKLVGYTLIEMIEHYCWQYTSQQSLVADLELMFKNARHYNEENSQVYKDAETLQRILHARLKALPAIDDQPVLKVTPRRYDREHTFCEGINIQGLKGGPLTEGFNCCFSSIIFTWQQMVGYSDPPTRTNEFATSLSKVISCWWVSSWLYNVRIELPTFWLSGGHLCTRQHKGRLTRLRWGQSSGLRMGQSSNFR